MCQRYETEVTSTVSILETCRTILIEIIDRNNLNGTIINLTMSISLSIQIEAFKGE
jgi:hypothetical protein